MTSDITYFPCAFKAVNYCLIYHNILTLALHARRVRVLVSKCRIMTRAQNILNSKRVVLSRSVAVHLSLNVI